MLLHEVIQHVGYTSKYNNYKPSAQCNNTHTASPKHYCPAAQGPLRRGAGGAQSGLQPYRAGSLLRGGALSRGGGGPVARGRRLP